MAADPVERSPVDDLDELRQRMQRARWRLRSAAQGGPEWDAASEHVEEIERNLRAAVRAKGSKHRGRAASAN
jgi:uncharacterized membrane protein YccC